MLKLAFKACFLAMMACGSMVSADEPSNCSDTPTVQEYLWFWDRIYMRCPEEVDRLWNALHWKSYFQWREEYWHGQLEIGLD